MALQKRLYFTFLLFGMAFLSEAGQVVKDDICIRCPACQPVQDKLDRAFDFHSLPNVHGVAKRAVLSDRLCGRLETVAVTGKVLENWGQVGCKATHPCIIKDIEYFNIRHDEDISFEIKLTAASRDLITGILGSLIASPPVTVMHCELVPFARDYEDVSHVLFPGWREEGYWAVKFNGEPFWNGSTGLNSANSNLNALKDLPCVSVTGALVTDRHDRNKIEIHPVSEVRIVDPSACQ